MFQDQQWALYIHYLAEQQVQSSVADNRVHSTQISKHLKRQIAHSFHLVLTKSKNQNVV